MNQAISPSPEALRFLGSDHRLLINNEWVTAQTSKTFDVINPANGEFIASVQEGGSADVDAAIEAARRAFDTGPWRKMRACDRGRLLLRFADLIEANREELSHIEVLDNGMPLAFANHLITGASEWTRFYAGLADKLHGRNASASLSGDGSHTHAYSSIQPVGVVGLILPWNGPAGTLIIKLAPALAAGCCCVIKPAENTPLSALRLGQLAIEAGFPPGVVNIVTGFGQNAGAALAQHPQVDKISFTGSTAVGKDIVRASAGNLKRVTLELGGKSPCMVFDDADLDLAIPGAAMAIFANTGQVCFAGSRLYVQRKVYDEVVDGIRNIITGMQIGSGFDPANALGPLISEKQRQQVEAYVNSGRQDGAEILAGGTAVDGPGYFYKPTVFSNIRADMKIVQEEIFGPVLVATPFDEMEEVLQLANDTRYGLGAGVFSRDVNKVHYMAERLEAGNVWVNSYGTVHPSLPFGGFKESGWGREMGMEGLEAFLEKKSVFIQLSI